MENNQLVQFYCCSFQIFSLKFIMKDGKTYQAQEKPLTIICRQSNCLETPGVRNKPKSRKKYVVIQDHMSTNQIDQTILIPYSNGDQYKPTCLHVIRQSATYVFFTLYNHTLITQRTSGSR